MIIHAVCFTPSQCLSPWSFCCCSFTWLPHHSVPKLEGQLEVLEAVQREVSGRSLYLGRLSAQSLALALDLGQSSRKVRPCLYLAHLMQSLLMGDIPHLRMLRQKLKARWQNCTWPHKLCQTIHQKSEETGFETMAISPQEAKVYQKRMPFTLLHSTPEWRTY